jgi:hypothetical protein
MLVVLRQMLASILEERKKRWSFWASPFKLKRERAGWFPHQPLGDDTTWTTWTGKSYPLHREEHARCRDTPPEDPNRPNGPLRARLMGCCVSSPVGQPETTAAASFRAPYNAAPRVKKVTWPTWKGDKPTALADLERRRAEFWETEPHFGGNRVIWEAIKAAAESQSLENAVLIFEAAGVIVGNETMTQLYDETGVLYSIPPYVYSAPDNLVRDIPRTGEA